MIVTLAEMIEQKRDFLHDLVCYLLLLFLLSLFVSLSRPVNPFCFTYVSLNLLSFSLCQSHTSKVINVKATGIGGKYGEEK